MKPSKVTLLLVNLLYLTVVLFIVLQSLTFTGQGGLAPLVIGVPTLGMLLIALGAQILPEFFKSLAPAKKTSEEASLDVASWAKATPVIAWTGGLFLLIFLIGFNLSIPLYTLSFLRFHGNVSWTKSFIAAGALWLLIYIPFDLLLHKPLFEGILFDAVLPLL